MTEEEFARLPPEQRAALMQQMSQAKEMRVDYGSMNNPYGQSSQPQNMNPPKRPNRQELRMPEQRGGPVTPIQIMRAEPPTAGEAGGPLTGSEKATMAQGAAQAAQSPTSLNPSSFDADGNPIKKKRIF